ncbi:MAG: hypothetical protein KGJ98_00450 [Chloroflexota bacterium]|nr:hypothetical protein [Chloroflexota bacterium]
MARSLPGWPEAGEILHSAGHAIIDPGAVPPRPGTHRRAATADAWLVGFNHVTRELMGSAPRLRVIARPGVGVDNDRDTARRGLLAPGVEARAGHGRRGPRRRARRPPDQRRGPGRPLPPAVSDPGVSARAEATIGTVTAPSTPSRSISE